MSNPLLKCSVKICEMEDVIGRTLSRTGKCVAIGSVFAAAAKTAYVS